VFFTDADRVAYLKWLKEYADTHGVDVLAYCLMTNHVHLVVVPATIDGLHRVLKPLHMRYAQRINRVRGWNGHLWQGRFFSSSLGDEYLFAAIRYVERNPVRAGMVSTAAEFQWSSAAARCGLMEDDVLSTKPEWGKVLGAIGDWSAWLADGDDIGQLTQLRRNADCGLPCGAEEFVRRLEDIAGCCSQYRPPGRPRKKRD
jgi:putative transposase